jgi:hypothetical protein
MEGWEGTEDQVALRAAVKQLLRVVLAPFGAWSAFREGLASGGLYRYDSDSDASLWLLLISAGNADGSWFAGLPDIRRLEDDDQQFERYRDDGTARP